MIPQTIRQNKELGRLCRAQYSRALRQGVLRRPKHCSNCDFETKVHGHHNDYSKPLDVMWLCPACHRILHHRGQIGLLARLGINRGPMVKAVKIHASIVPRIESLLQEIKVNHYLKLNFAQATNMLVREGLDIHKGK